MKMLALVCFFNIIVSYSVNACMFPFFGKEYDEQIKIKQLNNENHYSLNIPRSLHNSKGWPELTLVYFTHEIEKNCTEEIFPDGSQSVCVSIDTYREELKIKSKLGEWIDYIIGEKSYEGEFIINPKEGYSVALEVAWYPEICPIQASKLVKK